MKSKTYKKKKNSLNKDSYLNTNEDIDTDISPPLSPKKLPFPKASQFYSTARAAYLEEKDYPKAEIFYQKAIEHNDHKTSAIKDLVCLIHQQSRTQEAFDLLKSYEEALKFERKTYENLCKALHVQLLKKDEKEKYVKISRLARNSTKEDVSKLFKIDLRIKDYKFYNEINYGEVNYFCIIAFATQSSARKTLEGFLNWDEYVLEWVTDTGKFISDAHYAKQKIEEHRKTSPTFNSKVFDRDERGYLYPLPIDRTFESGEALPYFKGIEKLIGKDLLKEILAV